MESKSNLDRHSERIVVELQKDARLSNAEIGRRIGLSPTAVADRICDLENDGVIKGYGAIVDPAKLGLPITAMITMTCDGDRCKKLTSDVESFPEVLECHRLTGDAIALLKVAVRSIAALEDLVDRLAVLGKPSTALVLSSPLVRRAIDMSTTNNQLKNSRARERRPKKGT